MPSLKVDSAELTNQYLRMLMAEIRVKEMGGDAPISSINAVNSIRANVNMGDESIKRQLRSRFVRESSPDPDADCP